MQNFYCQESSKLINRSYFCFIQSNLRVYSDLDQKSFKKLIFYGSLCLFYKRSTKMYPLPMVMSELADFLHKNTSRGVEQSYVGLVKFKFRKKFFMLALKNQKLTFSQVIFTFNKKNFFQNFFSRIVD